VEGEGLKGVPGGGGGNDRAPFWAGGAGEPTPPHPQPPGEPQGAHPPARHKNPHPEEFFGDMGEQGQGVTGWDPGGEGGVHLLFYIGGAKGEKRGDIRTVFYDR